MCFSSFSKIFGIAWKCTGSESRLWCCTAAATEYWSDARLSEINTYLGDLGVSCEMILFHKWHCNKCFTNYSDQSVSLYIEFFFYFFSFRYFTFYFSILFLKKIDVCLFFNHWLFSCQTHTFVHIFANVFIDALE